MKLIKGLTKLSSCRNKPVGFQGLESWSKTLLKVALVVSNPTVTPDQLYSNQTFFQINLGRSYILISKGLMGVNITYTF